MRGWDAGVQGSRKRGEHTLDCVKHRGSRWRGEFVFKKLPLPPSLPLSLTLSSLLSPCSATAIPFFFFSSSSCLTPSPSLVLAYRIFSAYPYPFHPTWLYSSATEDDLRDNSHRALLDPRARFSFLSSPFYLFFSFLFFFLFFSFPFFSSFLSFPFSPTSSSSSSSLLFFSLRYFPRAAWKYARGMPRITDKCVVHGCTRVKCTRVPRRGTRKRE